LVAMWTLSFWGSTCLSLLPIFVLRCPLGFLTEV
jgi:hypothetical protein